MKIINADVFTENHVFEKHDICIKKDRIVSSCPNGDEVIDAEGLFAVPGFVDVHLHGALGSDFCDGTEDAIKKIAVYEASRGVLAICPATMTMEKEMVKRALSCISSYEGEGASVLGINLEGPFINKDRCGAQDPNFVLPFSDRLF